MLHSLLSKIFKVTVALLCLIGAAIVGYTIAIKSQVHPPTSSGTSNEKEPLYWVAPMDSSYRRDKPGKSPMGMDLVPVYEQASSPGEVIVSTNMINTLGVKTQEVVFDKLAFNITTTAVADYNENAIIHVHPRVQGWVERLYVRYEQARVKKGDPLYSLYSPTLVNAQKEYLLALGQQQQSLIKAARAQLVALKISDEFITELASTKQVKQRITFHAKQNGIVKQLGVREGFFVNPTDTIMSIADTDTMWVHAEVFAIDAPLVHKGMPVTLISDNQQQQVIRSRVDYIYPQVDELSRTVKVRMLVDNKDHTLKANTLLNATFTANAAFTRALVPLQAVIQDGTADRVVLATGDGQFKSVAVNLGADNGELVEVKNGLQRGDKVVVSSQFLIDSESNIHSDLQRLNASGSTVQWASVFGTIKEINIDAHTLTVAREAIEKWGRGPATMAFLVNPEVDLKALKTEQRIYFTFEVGDDFVITEIAGASAKESADD